MDVARDAGALSLQRALPSTPFELQATPENQAPPPPPPPQSPGVIEWANRAALFSRLSHEPLDGLLPRFEIGA